VHSWRSLWSRDGKPFLLNGFHPWCRDSQLARRLFLAYAADGIYRTDSHIVSDQVIPHCRIKSMVDTSEWLLKTAFVQKLGFCEEYTYHDWIISRAEDSKLLDRIVSLGIPVPSTCQPTLKYYLGGYSNNWSEEAAQEKGWL